MSVIGIILTMVFRFDCKYSILRKFKSFLTISHTDDPLWTRYWGVMKNDKLNLWLYPSDEDVKESVFNNILQLRRHLTAARRAQLDNILSVHWADRRQFESSK